MRHPRHNADRCCRVCHAEARAGFDDTGAAPFGTYRRDAKGYEPPYSEQEPDTRLGAVKRAAPSPVRKRRPSKRKMLWQLIDASTGSNGGEGL